MPAGALVGQAALVFGASSGIGRATARCFAEAGAAVAAVARSRAGLDELAAEVRAAGGTLVPLPADVADRPRVDAVVAQAWETLGDTGIVVNCAGTNVPNRRAAELRQADWDTLLAVNLTGAFNTIHATLPRLRARGGGLIVQVASVSARWGDASGPAYQAAKAGVVGLCQGVMFEERLHGIRVSAILPGLVETPLLRKRAQMPPREVLDRALQPEDVAQVCLFLATLPARAYVPELAIMPPALQCVGQTNLS